MHTYVYMCIVYTYVYICTYETYQKKGHWQTEPWHPCHPVTWRLAVNTFVPRCPFLDNFLFSKIHSHIWISTVAVTYVPCVCVCVCVFVCVCVCVCVCSMLSFLRRFPIFNIYWHTRMNNIATTFVLRCLSLDSSLFSIYLRTWTGNIVDTFVIL